MILIKQMKKATSNFTPTDDSDVTKNTGYLDEKLKNIDGHISYFEKDYNEIELLYNKQSVKGISIRRAGKTTIQVLYDRSLFDIYANVDKLFDDFLYTTRHRVDLEEVNDVAQGFC